MPDYSSTREDGIGSFSRLLAWSGAGLLLVPLQEFATWRVLSQAQGAQAMQRNVLDERVTGIRQAIEAATSPEDLQARFSRLKAPAPSCLRQPSPFP
jgi:hypothetical protein